jgi:hypothetical protein
VKLLKLLTNTAEKDSSLRLLAHFKRAVDQLQNDNGGSASFDFSVQRHEVLHNNIRGNGDYHMDVEIDQQKFIAAVATKLPMQPSRKFYLYHSLMGIKELECQPDETDVDQTASALKEFAKTLSQKKKNIIVSLDRM